MAVEKNYARLGFFLVVVVTLILRQRCSSFNDCGAGRYWSWSPTQSKTSAAWTSQARSIPRCR